ncbi:MAG: tRNA (guanosine(37)-N1)-methyltransferase TrmD [Myxococcales bacterium]|nr:tRNA (guanosine(37)-N1)-methyltransferase TrmD [Polyangiaceae bacterium]MDW8251027.1 tRNA (guanosine(37)-N1)-methyltransferase TrmD [Myxococcales bacterium]
MRVDLVTLFPELFVPFLDVSFLGKARSQGVLQVRLKNPREFGLGKHKSVDDTPYGGGSGMVLRVDCLVHTMEALDAEAGDRAHRILLSPQGIPYHQRKAVELSTRPALMLICGRYEGPDARISRYVDEEISLGDFVMIGGEVAAMAILESVVRLLPGVLGNEASTREESHSLELGGLLEYPHYTRPLVFRGDEVPEILRRGNHAAIAAWRYQQAREVTARRRPELLAAHDVAHPPPPKQPRGRRNSPSTPTTSGGGGL